MRFEVPFALPSCLFFVSYSLFPLASFLFPIRYSLRYTVKRS